VQIWGRTVGFGALASVAILTASLALVPAASASRSAHTTIAIELYDGEIKILKHPKRFRLDLSPDAYVDFFGLRWTTWGGTRAVGTGRARSCSEGGANGQECHSSRVRLTASRRRQCGDDYSYDRLVARGPAVGSTFTSSNGVLAFPVIDLGCAEA
jgi:hypothetical protein